ncbi:hypothetical protein [Dinoroseobacter sp. S76]|uniref:hypothetical protein n=1 Tax=Dinoroseobacter sp. S76 TaxID=3415124 RepID=UPI003C7B04EE
MWRAVGLGLIALTAGGALAQAETVTLTSRSDGFAVTGDLRAFDGTYFQIEAEHGLLTLSADQVTCAGAGCPAPNETTGFAVTAAHGPGSVLLPALLQAYARARDLPLTREAVDDSHILFELGNAETPQWFTVRVRLALPAEGFADLAVGEADLVLSDRLVSSDEMAIAQDAGIGDLTALDQERILAFDALVAATSPRRPSQAITAEGFRALWYNRRPDWAGLGYPAAPLRLHARAHGEDLAKLDDTGASPGAPVTYHENGADLAAVLRDQPSGLGLLPLSRRGPAQALPIVGSCGLTHAPSTTGVALGRYPWTFPLAIYAPDRRMPLDLLAFLAFLETPDAALVLQRAGYVLPNARVVESSVAERVFRAMAEASAEELQVLQTLSRALQGADQLGLSLRPAATRRDLRALSERALDVLAQFEPNAELVMVAYADTVAQAQADAQQARIDLAEARGNRPALAMDVIAMGAALPIACSEDRWAAEMNRRIDLWQRPLTDSLRIEN